ncbi:BOP1, N-terminal domain [Dillenia turbinata]|uniref:BOP1, N-terminal domain n=1 Tax=Dillenia turbinata TaxID=194707 RepID=A0AAN8ZI25_9MAGN
MMNPQVVQYVRAIRKGWIKFDKPKEEKKLYLLWGDDSSSSEKAERSLAYIPPPKPKLAGHEESYNPSLEYIPTQEEINSYQLMFEEDRPKFIPRRFTSLRGVPAYEKALNESFERCLDLYLCPRVRKKRINIDPESLKPKLPSRKDLKPYPTTCYIEYKGHKNAVMSISTEVSGQWIASGSTDGTVRIWEVETGRCLRVWEVGDSIQDVAWNPSSDLPILAIVAGEEVIILNTGLGNGEVQEKIKEILRIKAPSALDDSDKNASVVRWSQDDQHEGIRLKHFKKVSSVEWHHKGDYFSVVMPDDILFLAFFNLLLFKSDLGVVFSNNATVLVLVFVVTSSECDVSEKNDLHQGAIAILIHRLSRKETQIIPFKLHGLPVTATFHPKEPILFISTKKNVRVYELVKKKRLKKLETGLREVSSIAIHPKGDNVIVGSKDGKLCWFDMDLSSKPYKILKCHPKDINNVAFHRKYPLFASCSDDCTAYVFHGMVYSDLNQNPLIVPLEILRGHKSSNGSG